MGYNSRTTVCILDDEHKDKSLDTFERLRRRYREAEWAIDQCGRSTGNEGSCLSPRRIPQICSARLRLPS